jgi:hypothetical protein
MKQLLIIPCLFAALTAQAVMSLGPWVPLFKGVDHAIGTNALPDATFPRRQSVNFLRVDLQNPDVQLLHTPPAPGPIPESRETLSMTTSNFLKGNNLQVAVNANFFCCPEYNSEGLNAEVEGLAISRGTVVSSQEGPASASVFLFTTNKQATVIHTNWPATNTAGIYTAVAGVYPLVIGGVNFGANVANFPGIALDIHNPQPRTAYGLSQNRRYLYLMIIDGRQSPYSDSATDPETAAWLLLGGAWDGVSMDGGGSVTMVKADAFNNPVDLNHSSYIPQSGRERIVGSHLGVYAKPLTGFINDVNILPLDITATVNWTTISNSSSQVEYGTTTNLGTFSVLDPTPVLNHSVNLTGLVAGARYYYRALSVFNGTPFSATGAFTATNYNVTTTRPVFGITKSWKWNTNNLDGINWKATNYNDSSWSSGPGLLYVETSFSVSPKNTPLPPNNGLPVTGVPVFPTYYFRTTFNYTNSPSATTLTFSNYVDDGYVYYLNGVEIQRTRMPAAPTVITNKTVATANPCAGDANCPDFYTTSGNLITNLVMGTNVLAVEVHQSSNGNIDMAFGSALFANFTTYLLPTLNVARAGNVTTLSWNSPGYVLQQSSQISSPPNSWTDIPGPVNTSPFSITNSSETKFYRLRN